MSEFKNTLFKKDYTRPTQRYFQPDAYYIGVIDTINTISTKKSDNDEFIQVPLGRRIDVATAREFKELFDDSIGGYDDIMDDITDDFINTTNKEKDRIKSYFTVELDLFKNGDLKAPEVAKFRILNAIHNAYGKVVELIMPDRQTFLWFINHVIYMLNDNHKSKLLLKKGPTWDGFPKTSDLLEHVNKEYLAYAYGFRF